MADSVTIAFKSNSPWYFKVDTETQTIVEHPVRPVNGWYSNIPWDWEIIKSFLDHYSLTPTWIDCDPGLLDEETGTWTGAVGMVRICILTYYKNSFRLRGMRQTGLFLYFPTPLAGTRLLCVIMLSCLSLFTGGHNILRRELSSGTSPTCFTLRPGCGHS